MASHCGGAGLKQAGKQTSRPDSVLNSASIADLVGSKSSVSGHGKAWCRCRWSTAPFKQVKRVQQGRDKCCDHAISSAAPPVTATVASAGLESRRVCLRLHRSIDRISRARNGASTIGSYVPIEEGPERANRHDRLQHRIGFSCRRGPQQSGLRRHPVHPPPRRSSGRRRASRFTLHHGRRRLHCRLQPRRVRLRFGASGTPTTSAMPSIARHQPRFHQHATYWTASRTPPRWPRPPLLRTTISSSPMQVTMKRLPPPQRGGG